MTYTLSIRPEAEEDISEAFQFYEYCRESLGADFMLCVEESLARILKSPAQYRYIHKHVRRALIRRFPYGIYFVIINSNIVIIGVVHARKNPAHWRDRVE